MSKINRDVVYNKFGGLCAYSGTLLDDDWQVEHIVPADKTGRKNNGFDNLLPVQKLINHYKRHLSLEDFRVWYMSGLHERLAKLPKNPRTEKSEKRIIYMNRIANYFNITEDRPFGGKFYFETIPPVNLPLR